MPIPVLATKLYIPPPRPQVVPRPRLMQRLNDGLHRKLTLLSAAAGSGKTTLLSEWISRSGLPTAWLSLDAGDSDPVRFLTYLVAALQTVSPKTGEGVLSVLQAPQPPPVDSILTSLLNEMTTIAQDFVLVLDDYHVIESRPVDDALAFLLTHLPPRMHLIIATREDPQLPLARLRARGQLTEVRVNDLRFTSTEAAGFLNQVMGLNLSVDDIAALETRTEGWIVGLQLAALSMQGHADTAGFIKSFTGSHHFVLDYLVEEVLAHQPESVQAFLLQTSILDRMCGDLCDAVLDDPAVSGQDALEYIQRANLFIVPLDNERRWYRYHHLFGDLLRQRLKSTTDVAELHHRAAVWYEANGLDAEAFYHAAAAGDIEHTARLVEGKGMPLFFRGAFIPVLNWLKTLPPSVLDERPALWVMYASVLIFASQLGGVESKLQAAEKAMQNLPLDDYWRNQTGHIALMRATLAVALHQADVILAQSQRALEYLYPENLAMRTATTWTLGYAYWLQGNRAAAYRAYSDAIAASERIGHYVIRLMAGLGLGNMQEKANSLPEAAETYRRVLQIMGEPPLPVACEAYLGLARISYEWNDLPAAQQHAEQSVRLARQLETIDRAAASEIFLARLRLAQGDVSGASAIMVQVAEFVRQNNFVHRLPDIAAMQVSILLHQGNLTAAAHLSRTYDLPLSQAQILLAQGNPSEALVILAAFRAQVEAKQWHDDRLRTLIFQSVAHELNNDRDSALDTLAEALTLAEPGGFMRMFTDRGLPMVRLLTEAAARGILPDYAAKLLAVLDAETRETPGKIAVSPSQGLIEPLSVRELEVLRLIAQGLSNYEIAEQLFLALNTVKGHNQKIFGKLGVERRTEAVARARELGLL